MLNIFKNLPIFEIVLFVFLNGILFFFSIVTSFVFSAFSYDEPQSLWQNLIDILFMSWILIIAGMYFYTIIYITSTNRFIIKLVYMLKYHTWGRYLLYLLLILISPAFCMTVITLRPSIIIPGICATLAFPLMLLYAYWGLENRLSHRMKKIYKRINVLLSIVIPFIIAGFVYDFNSQSSYGDTRVLEFTLYTVTILTGTLLLLTEESKILLDKIKKYKWHVMPLWASIIYAVIWGVKNNWCTFYVLFTSIVLLLMILFESPILKLKAKNLELRREVEEMYINKNNCVCEK